MQYHKYNTILNQPKESKFYLKLNGVFGTTTMGRRFGKEFDMVKISVKAHVTLMCVGAFAGGFYL